MIKYLCSVVVPFVLAISLLISNVSCGGTREIVWKDTAAAVQIRVYAIPLQSDVDTPVTIENIYSIASYRDTIRDRTIDELDTNQEYYDPEFDGPTDYVGWFANEIHSLRVLESGDKEYEVRGLCEVIYLDGTSEKFLIDRNGYFRFGDVVLRDSYSVLNLFGFVCQPK